jgi:vancomycin permeability regulator SanA
MSPKKTNVSMSIEDLFREQETLAPPQKRKIMLIKRLLLLILATAQSASYFVLTEARYGGQGLKPIFFRLTTVGDVLSVMTSAVSIALTLFYFFQPEKMSFGRAIIATLISLSLLWVTFGLRKFDASDFSPVASVALITGIFALLGVLITRNRTPSSGAKRTYRAIRNTIFVFGAYAAFGFFYSFFYPVYSDIAEIAKFNADAGIVLGAAVWSGNQLGNRPSPTLKERVDIGYELLTQKAIPRLVVTGSNAPGEKAEGDVARAEMIKRGIDPSSVIAENASHSTYDQVIYIRDELKKKQGWSRFVVVSDQYHLARVIEICKFNGITAIGSPSRIRQPFLDLGYYRIRESIALLAYWLLGK